MHDGRPKKLTIATLSTGTEYTMRYETGKLKGGRAIIVGGGIGGITAALTLKPHFEEVCVIEQDIYPLKSSARKHTPQDAHLHALLAKGLELLTQLVPDLPTWLDEMGLQCGDLTQDIHFAFDGKWMPRFKSGILVRPCTRPVLEHLLLRAAHRDSNIIFRQGSRVTGLVGRDAVQGVRLVDDEGNEQSLDGSWVIDASGRASHLPQWLSEIGIVEIPEEVVNAGVSYHSCLLRPPPGASADWIAMASSPRFPSQPEGAGVMRVADGEWLSALIAYAKTSPPQSPEELIDRIARLYPEPFAEQVRNAEVISPRIYNFGKIINRRRLLSRVKNWPDGLCAIGDVVCALNPRYGQGMTVAVMSAHALGTTLEQHWARQGSLVGLASRFQRTLEKLLAVPWQIALVEDRLWSARMAENRPGRVESIAMSLSQRLLQTAFTDTETYIRLMRVAHMLERPTHLATPKTIVSLLRPAS